MFDDKLHLWRWPERRQRRCRFAALLLTVLIAAGAWTERWASADLVPHQAIYRLSLAGTTQKSKFNGIEGAAVSLVERSCDGWTVTEQVVMSMSTIVGGVVDREMSFKARESHDGLTYYFDSTSVTNGNVETYRGNARSRAKGKSEAEFITPRPFEMPLPDGTRFYVGMTRWLLELAQSGARSGETFAFDGTDDEGPQKVSVFIVNDRKDGTPPKIDSPLLDVEGWQVRLAFFKIGSQASAPLYEISMYLLENGIIPRFRLIFDDMTVDQTLEDILPASDENCG